jgi:hypothetical protein
MVGASQHKPNPVQAPTMKVTGLQVKALWVSLMEVEMKEKMEVVVLMMIDHHR